MGVPVHPRHSFLPVGRAQQRGIVRRPQSGHLSALQERLARSGRTLVPGHAVAQQRHAQPQLGGGIHRRFGLAQRDDEVAVDHPGRRHRRQHAHRLRGFPLLSHQGRTQSQEHRSGESRQTYLSHSYHEAARLFIRLIFFFFFRKKKFQKKKKTFFNFFFFEEKLFFKR